MPEHCEARDPSGPSQPALNPGVMARRQSYIPGLDLVRFAAAMMVMLFHLGYVSTLANNEIVTVLGQRLPAGTFAGLFHSGWIGVEIFFVISGLVIANSAESTTAWVFARRRIYRLYPAVWICATTSMLILLFLGIRDWLPVRYLNAMLLLPLVPRISDVYWTLGVEVVFYALVFVWKARMPSAALSHLAGALLVWSGLYICMMALTRHQLPNIVSRPLLMNHGVYFSIGIWIWTGTRRSLLRREQAMLAASILLAIVQIVIRAHSLRDDFGLSILIWLVALFAIAFAGREPVRAWTANLQPWSLKTGRLLGLMTYPIYLVHVTLGAAIMREGLSQGWSPRAALMVAVPAVCVFALTVVLVGEPHIRRLLRQGLEPAPSRSARGA